MESRMRGNVHVRFGKGDTPCPPGQRSLLHQGMRRRVGRRQGRPVPKAPRPCRQSNGPEESERRKATYLAKGLRERVGKQYKGPQRTRKLTTVNVPWSWRNGPFP